MMIHSLNTVKLYSWVKMSSVNGSHQFRLSNRVDLSLDWSH